MFSVICNVFFLSRKKVQILERIMFGCLVWFYSLFSTIFLLCLIVDLFRKGCWPVFKKVG